MPNSDWNVSLRDVREAGDFVVTGVLNLQGVGKIVTSTDTGSARIVISSTGKDAIRLFSGSSLETRGPMVQTAQTPAHTPFLVFFGPKTTSHSSEAGVRVYESSVHLYSQDASTALPYVSVTTSHVTVGGSLSVAAHSIPSADATYDLGSASLSWRYLYAYSIYDESGTERLDLSSDWTPAGNVSPAANGTKNLGSTGYRWKNLYTSRLVASSAGVLPTADNTYDLGGSVFAWKDAYIKGVAYLGAIDELGLSTAIGSWAHIVPVQDNKVKLGSTSLGWSRTHTHKLYTDGLTATTGSDPVQIMVGGTLYTVTAGSSDSGGAGYRILRVPNT